MKKYLRTVIAIVIVAALVVLPSYSFSSPTIKVGTSVQSNRNGSGSVITR